MSEDGKPATYEEENDGKWEGVFFPRDSAIFPFRWFYEEYFFRFCTFYWRMYN